MSELRSFLAQTFAEAGGFLPLEKFVGLALYHEEFGYYGHNVATVGGNTADFATSVTLDTGLSRAVADWIRTEQIHWRELCGSGASFTLIEVGAGSGALAEQVLKHWSWWQRRKLDYRIVETSAPLREAQQKRLRRYGVRHAGSVREALERATGIPLVFSNELVDAFPPIVLQRGEGQWFEVGVDWTEAGGLREVFRPFQPDAGDPSFSLLDKPLERQWRESQRIELQPSFYQWWREWAAGRAEPLSLLTIDYGRRAGDWVAAVPLGGTLRGYYQHERKTGGEIYQRFGKQDLTVDVNFTDLENWGRTLGFSDSVLQTQGEFLADSGQSESPMAGEGAGEEFLVLRQRYNAV